MRDTRWKIMNAAIELIRMKGYAATTTKDIAVRAEVNECTIFRKFGSKREIILCALDEGFKPQLTENSFKPPEWNLTKDLEMFAAAYLENVTEDFVKMSVGLRDPQIYGDVSEKIREVPEVMKKALERYFSEMYQRGCIGKGDFEGMATMFLAVCFGFVFFKASFLDELTALNREEYMKQSVKVFVSGIENRIL